MWGYADVQMSFTPRVIARNEQGGVSGMTKQNPKLCRTALLIGDCHAIARNDVALLNLIAADTGSWLRP